MKKIESIDLFLIFLSFSLVLTSCLLEHLNATKFGRNINIYGLIFFIIYTTVIIFFYIVTTKEKTKNKINFSVFSISTLAISFTGFSEKYDILDKEAFFFETQTYIIYSIFVFSTLYIINYIND